MGMKSWNVRVHTASGTVALGQVEEQTTDLARCAALSKYGIPEDEDIDPTRRGIRSNDEFDVSPA